MTKLPTETRPMRMDPDLAAFLEAELKPLRGKVLEAAQAAILRVRTEDRGFSGTWDALVANYREAIAQAIVTA